jgi:hypothetical protein
MIKEVIIIKIAVIAIAAIIIGALFCDPKSIP